MVQDHNTSTMAMLMGVSTRSNQNIPKTGTMGLQTHDQPMDQYLLQNEERW